MGELPTSRRGEIFPNPQPKFPNPKLKFPNQFKIPKRHRLTLMTRTNRDFGP